MTPSLRTSFPRRIVPVVLLLMLSVVPAIAEPIKVLTIGNSFADNSTRFLNEVADSQGVEMLIVRANLGGCDLERHARHLREYRQDPTDPSGRPYAVPGSGGNKRRSLVEALQSDLWDFVTIQQVSRRSFDPASYEPFAGTLVEVIGEAAASAEILVHQTWAYREDHPWFQGAEPATAEGNATPDPRSQIEMYRRLTSAYDQLAARYQLRILPVGDAFQQARGSQMWRFQYPDSDFDYDHPAEGTIPRQTGSINVGWTWRESRSTGAMELRRDSNHANDAGCYLGACVWFERITGQALTGEVWKPESLTEAQAASLRRIAHEAVAARDF